MAESKLIKKTYSILEQIGSGVNSKIYLALDVNSGKKFSLKKLYFNKQNFQNEAFIRFKREEKIISQLSHPNIIKVHDIFEENQCFYIVMEYFQGSDLKNAQNFDLNEKILIIQKAAYALEYIHKNGVIHRDIKPSNILVKKNGEIKIIDFGLAYFANYNEKLNSEHIIGSFAYMPPEQTGILRRAIDNRSDLYSLGGTFYELITGHPPFYEKDISTLIYHQLAKKPKKPSSIKAQIPPILNKIILKLLAKEPEERYQTALGLVIDLQNLIDFPDKVYFKIGQKDKREKLNFQIKLVGREKEIHLLAQYYKEVRRKKLKVVTIKGQSGLGKSKLVDTFREEIIDDHTKFYSYKCTKTSKNIPFISLIELFNQFINWVQLKRNFSKKYKFLPNLFPQLKKGKLKANLKISNIHRNEIFEEMLLFLDEYKNKSETLVFFIDDIQWIDEDTLQFVEYISKKNYKLELMLVFTVRENLKEKFLKRLENNKLNHIISLEPISGDILKKFILRVINSNEKFSENFYKKIYDKTVGNPFFILEMIKALYDEHIIYYDENLWKLNPQKFKNFRFEKDVTKLIIKRVHALNIKEKLLLSLASIIGKEFNLTILLQLIILTGNNEKILNVKSTHNKNLLLEKLIALIDNIRSRQLIKLDLLKGKGIYSFIHDKIQEVLHDALKEEEKQRYHMICAETMEELYKEEIETYTFQITYHFNQTESLFKKIFYNKKSYEKAISRFSLNETVYYMNIISGYYLQKKKFYKRHAKFMIDLLRYKQMIGQIESSFKDLNQTLNRIKGNDWEEEIDIYTIMGRGYFFLADTQTALEYYKNALKLAQKIDKKSKMAEPYQFIGGVYYYNFQFKEAEEYLTKAILFANKNDISTLLFIYGLRSWIYLNTGNFKKQKQDVEFIESNINKIKDPTIISQLYQRCSFYYLYSGCDLKKGFNYAYLSFRLLKNLNDTLHEYFSYFARILSYLHLGKYDKAIKNYHQVLHLSKEHNLILAIHLIHAFAVEAYLFQGKFTLADEIATKGLAEKDEVQHKGAIPCFFIAKAINMFINDNMREALKYLNKGYEFYKKTGFMLYSLFIILFKAYVIRKMGNYVESKKYIKELNLILDRKRGLGFIYSRAKKLLRIVLEEKKKEKKQIFDTTHIGFKEKIQLANIIKTSQSISSILEIDSLLKVIIRETLKLTGAERGALIIWDKNLEIEYEIYQGVEQEEKIKIPTDILNVIINTKKGVVLTKEISGKYDFKVENIKSMVCAPLITKDNLVGILYLDSQLLSNLFSYNDLELINVFTSQAAISIENARLHNEMIEKARIRQEIEIAEDLQLSLLPEIRKVDGYDISAFMETADEVGGDYYDFYLEDEPYFGVFGDVSGHGLKSGLIMMMAEVAFNTIMRNPSRRIEDLASIYQQINLILHDNIQNRLGKNSKIGEQYSYMFMTFNLFRFDLKGNFEVVGADFATPFICRKNGGIEEVDSNASLIGIKENAISSCHAKKVKLNSGDLIVFYSDGITEGKKYNRKDIVGLKKTDFLYGRKRLYEIIQKNKDKASKEIISMVIDSVHKWIAEQDDDMTIVIVKKE